MLSCFLCLTSQIFVISFSGFIIISGFLGNVKDRIIFTMLSLQIKNQLMDRRLCLNILTYHNVSMKNRLSYTSVSRDLFEKHLNLLLNSGLQFFSEPEVYEGEFLYNYNKVLITFDDGYEDLFYHVLPLLGKFRFYPLVFVPAGFIGKKNYWDFSPFGHLKHLTRDMLINMAKNGFVIGAHSMSHTDLRKCEKKALYREVCDSKKLLEDIIGREVYAFAYPFGLYNRRVVEMVRSCGYKYAFATSKGIKGNPFAIERALVYFIDFNPLYLLRYPECLLLRVRNKLISTLSSLTPLYKKFIYRRGKG